MKVKKLMFVLILIAFVSSCSSKQPGEKSNSELDKEQTKIEEHQAKMAENVPPAQNLRDANQLLHMRRCPEAIVSYKKFLEKYPKDAWAWNLIGLAYLCNSQYNEALTSFQNSLAIQPTYTDLHNNMGIAYMELKNYDAAKQEFIKTLEDPNYAKAGPYYNLAKLSFLQGSYEESRALAKKSLEDVAKGQNGLPKEPGPLLLYGHSLQRLNRLQEAEVAFRDLLKLDGENLEANYAMGTLMLSKGDKCNARTYFEKVADGDPLGELGQQSIQSLKTIQCPH